MLVKYVSLLILLVISAAVKTTSIASVCTSPVSVNVVVINQSINQFLY